MEYDAFISYSHSADRALALALQSGLQRFAKPWYRARALRVFRDDASLSASPDLWSSIARALDGSRYFVLLASPDAGASPWVAREVERWRAGEQRENVLVALTEGELAWDEGARDFDWSRTTSLPPTLRGAFDEEPRWVDLRWARATDNADLSPSHPAFREALADLAAPIRGLDKDELASEEVRQHRRTMRVVRAAGATLTSLVVIAVFFLVLSVLRGNEAQRQLRLAQSRQLAAQAQLDRGGEHFDRGLLLALAAARLAPTEEARDSLVSGLEETSHLERVLPGVGGGVSQLAVSDGGRTLEVLRTDGTVFEIGPSGRRVMSRALPNERDRGGATEAAGSADGRLVASSGPSGAVVVWDRKNGKIVATPVGPGASTNATQLAFSPDRRLLAMGSAKADLELWSLSARRRVRLPTTHDTSGAWTLGFSPSGTVLAEGRIFAKMIILRKRAAGWTSTELKAGPAFAFDPSGRTLAAARTDGSVVLLSVPSLHVIRRLASAGCDLSVLRFDADGTILAGGCKDGTVVRWRATGTRLGPPLRGRSGEVTALAFSADGRTLVSAHGDGRILVWAPSVDLLTTRVEAHNVSTVAFPAPDLIVAGSPGSFADSGGREVGALTRWNLATGTHTRVTLTHGLGPVTPSGVAFTNDGRMLLVTHDGDRVEVWDAVTGRPLRVALGGRRIGVEIAAASSAATVLAGTAPAAWDARTGRKLPLQRTAGADGIYVALSPDGHTLAAGGGSRLVVWALPSGRLIGSARGNQGAVAFDPAGKTLVAGNEIWNVAPWRLETQRLPTPDTAVASFSSDGRTLATVTSDTDGVRLWDVQSGRPLGLPLPLEPGLTPGVAFSGEGADLAASGASEIVAWRSLPLSRDLTATTKRVCDVLGRSLTRDEWRRFLPNRRYDPACAGVR